MTDGGIAHAIDGEIPKDILGKAKQAEESCPVDAIDLDEDQKGINYESIC